MMFPTRGGRETQRARHWRPDQARHAVITANGDDLTETDDHMKVAMRQIAGAFSQLEKARLVAKLKAARDRKRPTVVRRPQELCRGHSGNRRTGQAVRS